MSQSCSSCMGPKANLICRECESVICKTCVQIVESDRFAFLNLKEEDEFAGSYCNTCFDTVVAGPMVEYDETMERARDVDVFFVNQGKETRLIKRSEKTFKVSDCADRDETILRLAFDAAKAGYNTIVDVDLIYEKERDGSFKISNWKGSAKGANTTPKGATRQRRSPSR